MSCGHAHPDHPAVAHWEGLAGVERRRLDPALRTCWALAADALAATALAAALALTTAAIAIPAATLAGCAGVMEHVSFNEVRYSFPPPPGSNAREEWHLPAEERDARAGEQIKALTPLIVRCLTGDPLPLGGHLIAIESRPPPRLEPTARRSRSRELAAAAHAAPSRRAPCPAQPPPPARSRCSS